MEGVEARERIAGQVAERLPADVQAQEAARRAHAEAVEHAWRKLDGVGRGLVQVRARGRGVQRLERVRHEDAGPVAHVGAVVHVGDLDARHGQALVPHKGAVGDVAPELAHLLEDKAVEAVGQRAQQPPKPLRAIVKLELPKVRRGLDQDHPVADVVEDALQRQVAQARRGTVWVVFFPVRTRTRTQKA